MRKHLIVSAMLCLALACMLCVGALAEGAGYTVEFGYGGLEYVLPGDTSVAMSDIQDALGLPGEVTAVAVSAPACFPRPKKPGNGSSRPTGRSIPPSG